MISEVEMLAPGRTTREFEALGLGLECQGGDGSTEPAPGPPPAQEDTGPVTEPEEAQPVPDPDSQPTAQEPAAEPQENEPLAEPGTEPEPDSEVGTPTPPTATRTCADTDADGTPDSFDCSGSALDLHPSPRTVACAEDTCTIGECCTASRTVPDCETGYWRSAPEADCISWTPCVEGMQMAIAGSATQDQVCGVKLVATTVVSEAVDTSEFESQLAIASGAAGTVTILVTSFEQTISSAIRVPGTLSDYDTAAAKTQFRAGVADALDVDISSISELTITDARRRRLQAGTLTISYDVSMTDPIAAATVAEAAKDTTTFTEALVQAVNDAGGGGLSLEPSSVTVEPPTISTMIQYDIIIGTADSTVVSSVQEQLQDTAVMATALSAATGTSISADQVVASVVPAEQIASTSPPSSTSPADASDGLPIAALAGGGGLAMAIVILSWLSCRKRKVAPHPITDASHSKYQVDEPLENQARNKVLPKEAEPQDELAAVLVDHPGDDGLDHLSRSTSHKGDVHAEDCLPGQLGTASEVAEADAFAEEAMAPQRDLSSLSVGALRKLAVAEGVPSDEIEDARDSFAPKDALIELIEARRQVLEARAKAQAEAAAAKAAEEAPASTVAAVMAESSTNSRYKDEDPLPPLRQGGLHSVRGALDTAKNSRVAAKVLADDVAFHHQQPDVPATARDTHIRSWLRRFKLEAYAQALADDGYDDLQHITGLDEQEIDEVLEEIGMKKGHRRTFKREWAKLQ